jgi:hypothetical protein
VSDTNDEMWAHTLHVEHELGECRKQLAEAREHLGYAVRLLAEWAETIDRNGGGWDYWDSYYKEVMYGDNPLRSLLDNALKAARGGHGTP